MQDNSQDYLSDNEIDALLGINVASLAVGGLTGFELERRRRGLGAEGYKEAGKEFVGDLSAATNVLFNRTPHDNSITQALETGSTADPHRSIRAFSEDPSIADSRYRTTDLGAGYQSNPITQAAISARDAFNPSGEDFLSLRRQFRTQEGYSAEGPRSDTIFSRIPGVDGIRDALGTLPGGFSEAEREFRDQTGISLMKGSSAQRGGGVAGRLGSDFVNNGARSLWWVLNAPQAVVDIASEYTAAKANREGLYGQDLLGYNDALRQGWIEADGTPLNNSVNTIPKEVKDPYLAAQRRDTVDQSFDPNDVNRVARGQVYGRRRMGNNLSTLMALPAAYAINAGIGLTNPLGGTDGRKAILPSDEDPTRTSNVIGEVAAKYILGRQGDLLPWNEFTQVRPDVSKSEYNQYKAYRWDKSIDLNPFDDGKVSPLPLGIVKYNNDGINGAEVQFLGKDMPLSTAIFPTVAALAGTAAGAALGRYGTFNELGIDEARFRKNAVKSSTENKINRGLMSGTDTTKAKNKVEQLNVDIDRLNKRQEFVNRIPGINRISKKNAAATALIGGTTALLGSGIIGSEIERRRRESDERRFEN